jgi:arylsulfatase A-like enzyme
VIRALALAGVLLAIAGAGWWLRGDLGGGTRPGPGARPNVVLVVIDTLRADHLGGYGYARPTSRHLDALAADGVRFARAVTVAPTTFPSVSSLLTSISPLAFHTPPARDEGIPPEHTTLAEVFRAHGYRTAAVSGNPIVRRHPQEDRGFDQGFDAFDEECSAHSLDEVAPHSAPCITRRAVAALDHLGRGPFFLYVHYLDPHHPYAPPPESDRFSSPYTGRWYIKRGLTGPIMWWLYDGGEDPGIDARDIAHLRDLYDGEIASVDADLARLLRAFDARGLRDDTLFVVTSDHGESLMEHRHMGHGASLYETELHVPLIFHWRRRWSGATVRRDLACTTDVLPTILALVDLPIPAPAQGRALFAEDAGGAPGAHACLSAGRVDWETMRAGLFSIRTDTEKLIYDALADDYELYDLDADPGELRDAIAAGTAPRDPRLSPLRDRLAAQLGAATGAARATDGGGIDPQLRRALESLGYLR